MQPSEGQRIGNQINAATILARADFVKVDALRIESDSKLVRQEYDDPDETDHHGHGFDEFFGYLYHLDAMSDRSAEEKQATRKI